MSRIDDELALLNEHYSGVEFQRQGVWFRIPGYGIATPGWTPDDPDVCFQIADTFPSAAPYGFYVPVGIKFNGEIPTEYKEPAPSQPPFPGAWGFFSWQPEDGQWRPGATVKSGSNLTDWVRGFAKRFEDGR